MLATKLRSEVLLIVVPYPFSLVFTHFVLVMLSRYIVQPKQAKLLLPLAHLLLDKYSASLGLSPAVAHLVRINVIIHVLEMSYC